MKLFYYFLLLPVLLNFGCKHNNIKETAGADSIQTTDLLAEYRDTLAGKFNGMDYDTLISEPIDITKRPNLEWRIYSKKNTVDTLFLDKQVSVKMIFEGDLDGNGTDEFGVRREWLHGTWDSYFIFTSINRKWEYLIDPVWTYSFHFYDYLNHGNDVVSPTDTPGLIKVRFSDFRDEDACIVDTIIRSVTYPTINNSEI